jgi:hypothetical protein
VDLELVVDVGLDPLEDKPIGTLDLAIGFKVIDRGLIHSDSLGITEI